MDLLVAVPCDGEGYGGIPVVHIEGGAGRDHLDIHAQGVHVLDALLGGPLLHGVYVGLVAVGGKAMPGLTGGNGPLEAFGFVVGVNIYGAQRWGLLVLFQTE